jgi:hypothetical protein
LFSFLFYELHVDIRIASQFLHATASASSTSLYLHPSLPHSLLQALLSKAFNVEGIPTLVLADPKTGACGVQKKSVANLGICRVMTRFYRQIHNGRHKQSATGCRRLSVGRVKQQQCGYMSLRRGIDVLPSSACGIMGYGAPRSRLCSKATFIRAVAAGRAVEAPSSGCGGRRGEFRPCAVPFHTAFVPFL